MRSGRFKKSVGDIAASAAGKTTEATLDYFVTGIVLFVSDALFDPDCVRNASSLPQGIQIDMSKPRFLGTLK